MPEIAAELLEKKLYKRPFKNHLNQLVKGFQNMIVPLFILELKAIHQFDGHFPAAFVCSKSVTVDEAMIPYCGRTGLKQYMKAKPCKYAMKSHENKIKY
uniref:PiggyBac transposable element-derived protein domain-containing protein n=1 Tax=Romanomermis culicivorax TaxID=13658 RepID=A0A915KAF6_ROMCU